jgi:type I restriction-modification system DNA methylase subunit
MNLAIRGIDAQIAHGDTFHNDRHPDLKADCDAEVCARFVMAAEQAEWVP